MYVCVCVLSGPTTTIFKYIYIYIYIDKRLRDIVYKECIRCLIDDILHGSLLMFVMYSGMFVWINGIEIVI